MDLKYAFYQAGDFIKYLATSSTFAISFWIAVFAVLLLIFRRASVRFVWRSLHLMEDLVLQNVFFAKTDLALKVLFTMLALLPFFHFLPSAIDHVLTKLASLVIPFATLYILIQAFDLLVFDWYFSKHREANVPSVLRFVAIGAIYAVFGMVFLQVIFGLNILPLLATSTILTAVLGLALQDTLKNLFAGITLSFEKRFRQGDWIQFRLDANNVSVGQVLEIGWRTTKMRTLENTFSVIPNSMFATNHMINFTHSGATFMRYVELAVQVRADLNSLMPILAQAAERVEGVLSEPAPDVILFGVKPDHLLLRVRFSIGDFSQADVINSRVACETLKELEALQLVPALISAAPPPPPALPLSSSPAV